MSDGELAHLELLAEVDALVGQLTAWANGLPDWPAARSCQALVRRLAGRADSLRVRLEAPLVVATLGGTGTGKSSLVNALAGAEVVCAGRQRPTTMRPTLVCRADLSPEELGIDPDRVQVVHRDLPALRDLVLLDCPDPDTTEDTDAPSTNLSRLRELLPHCDVLLVTTTQQKYRSARVADELAAAASAARIVFVQTHADCTEDVRDDWSRILSEEYATGETFFVDSPAALADAQHGVAPRGEFARLVDFLTRELAGAAAHRIRRANFLDLLSDTLQACRRRINAGLPAIEQLETAVNEQRARLAQRLAEQMCAELTSNRRQWENRLLGEVTTRWGFSPFSCVLRLYHGLGGLVTGAGLLRARTPAQMALWGAVEGGRALRRQAKQRGADAGAQRAVQTSWDEGELRTAAIIVDGYTADTGLSRQEVRYADVAAQAAKSGAGFVTAVAADLQALIGRLAAKHTGWFTRLRYELALLIVLGVLLYRFGRNFFFDSWLAVELGLATEPAPLLGLDFFVSALFWMILWCAVLIWLFTGRLRRGLRAEILTVAQRWNTPHLTADLFAELETRCHAIRRGADDLQRFSTDVRAVRSDLARPDEKLGRRIADKTDG